MCFVVAILYVSDVVSITRCGAFFENMYVWTIIILAFQPIVVIFFTNLKYQTMDVAIFMSCFIIACWIASGFTYRTRVKK